MWALVYTKLRVWPDTQQRELAVRLGRRQLYERGTQCDANRVALLASGEQFARSRGPRAGGGARAAALSVSQPHGDTRHDS